MKWDVLVDFAFALPFDDEANTAAIPILCASAINALFGGGWSASQWAAASGFRASSSSVGGKMCLSDGGDKDIVGTTRRVLDSCSYALRMFGRIFTLPLAMALEFVGVEILVPLRPLEKARTRHFMSNYHFHKCIFNP